MLLPEPPFPHLRNGYNGRIPGHCGLSGWRHPAQLHSTAQVEPKTTHWSTRTQQGGGWGGDVLKSVSCSLVSDSLQPTDCSPPGSSVHGIFEARMREWVAISSSRGSSQPRGQTCISFLAGRFFTLEPPGKPSSRGTRESRKDGGPGMRGSWLSGKGLRISNSPVKLSRLKIHPLFFCGPEAALPPSTGQGWGWVGGCFWVSCEECCVISSVFAVAPREAAGQITQHNG